MMQTIVVGRGVALIAAAVIVVGALGTGFGQDITGTQQKNLTVYSVTGVFLESRAEGRVAVIRHEPVPGYMEAMTMPFNVKRPEELRPLKAGDQIYFRLS